MLTFQKLIYQLIQFWEKRGCIIHQGHDVETGAGTFNPATFLRCLGPEPYNTAYVEPSRRPKDGRYGENPNRVQLFHQFQVILKPSPPNVQEMYLRSLEAIGLKLKEHDIRFVHDDWESPTQGAHGLGWEVWIDGMEVTQFTYFQVIASLPLKPISAEITYGLERLAMYLQNVSNLFDLQWNNQYTYGEISKRSEVEWSTYNFTEASTEMWFRHFDDFEREAKHLLTKNLPLPAYDFVIKASHAFNLLEARGAVSVTERTGYIGRIRDLARLIAIEYIKMREKEGFPLLAKNPPQPPKKTKIPKLPRTYDPYRTCAFLLEIGSEQLPATFIPIGIRNLTQACSKLFEELKISHGEMRPYGTPQRLGILIHDLPEGTADKIIERRGPSIQIAFNAKGELTEQGHGFIKIGGYPSCSLEQVKKGKVKGLEIRGDHLFASLKEKGQSIYALLSQRLPSLILGLDFPKKMRWGNLDISYPRPIHWIVALYGQRVIPFLLGDVVSGNTSYGHAQLDPKKILIKEAEEIFLTLKQHKVLADVEERTRSISDQLSSLESTLQLQALEKKRVLEEVVYLTEWPTLTTAEFDARFLVAPSEILTSEMIEHQRYFPLADAEGKLSCQFVITADNTPSPLIKQGNQKVLSARLSDGLFLYNQDSKIPLIQFNEKLQLMTFQKSLGTMLEKVERVIRHAETINQTLALADQTKVARAALLCKADLTSQLVGEFPSLQGTIGKYYALKQGEEKEVAEAIEQHWYPKSEHSPLPKTSIGIVISLSDKIDNLLCYFSIGLKPTSSSDPYALRRQTIGLIKIFIENRLSVNLKELLSKCAEIIKDPVDIEEILHFIASRAQGVFEEYGFAKDTINACLTEDCPDPYDQFSKVSALHEFRSSSHSFSQLWEVYKRAKGQLEKEVPSSFNPALAKEPAELALLRALSHMEKQWKGILAEKQYARAFEEMAKLQSPLATLFDTVKILSDDPALRANRIALLHKVFAHFVTLLDFNKIKGAS